MKTNEFAGSLFNSEHAATIACAHWLLYGDDTPVESDREPVNEETAREVRSWAREACETFSGSYHASRIAQMDLEEVVELLEEVHSALDE